MKEDITDKELHRSRVLARLRDGKALVFRRSLFDFVGLALLFFSSLLVILAIYIFLPRASAGPPVELFVPIAILTVILHKKFNVKYTLSNRGLGIKRGLISLNLSEQAIAFSKLRAVEIKRDLIQRIFDVGDVGLSTILIDEPEILLRGIARPSEITAVINLYIAEYMKSEGKIEEIRGVAGNG